MKFSQRADLVTGPENRCRHQPSQLRKREALEGAEGGEGSEPSCGDPGAHALISSAVLPHSPLASQMCPPRILVMNELRSPRSWMAGVGE